MHVVAEPVSLFPKVTHDGHRPLHHRMQGFTVEKPITIIRRLLLLLLEERDYSLCTMHTEEESQRDTKGRQVYPCV